MSIDLNKIGTILRTHRESAGITLEEVSNVLCLRKSLIQAIETGKWEFLPHEVYVKSYLKEYACFLKIFNEIEADLTDKINTNNEEVDTNEQIHEEPIRVARKVTYINIPRKTLVYPIIVLILAGFYFVDKINRGVSIPASKIESTSSITTKSKPLSDNAVTDDSQTLPVTTEGKKLMITCNERTWISVVIDDAEKKEFMLNAQEMIILKAKDRFDLLIGNAGGVKLILDGRDTEFTGKSGEVKRIKLS
jgi:transcriptional regulator with XRE-family HTH domain